MSVITVSEQLVHYEAFGRGKPVVFVHGWLGSWRYWWPTMQALSTTHRSFALDLWGFGDSSKSVGDYTIESHVAMLDGFIDEMGIAKPFALVGHSVGAAVALSYTRHSGESVDRVAAVAMPMSKENVNGQLLGKSAKDVIDQSLVRFASHPEVVMGLKKTDVVAFEQSTSQLEQRAFEDDLRQVECPVLLIFGASDSLVKQPEDQPAVAEGTVRQCVSLENCSHFPMLEQPAVFNRLLREFVNGTGQSNLAPKKYWQRRTR